MKLSHLKLVKVVAEEKTLTSACDKLFLSQPALSHQLRDLENYCNAPVFKRIGKKMVPSSLGYRILETAERVLSEMKELERDIQFFGENHPIELRLASSCYTNYYWLPPVITDFYKKYPDSEVNISHEATDDPISFILSGDIDLAIVSSRPENINLSYAKAFDDELFVIVNLQHAWANRKYIEIEEFASETVIFYSRPITLIQKLLSEKRIKPVKSIKMQLTEARIEMVKANLGVTVMASWAVQPYLDRKEVVAVRVSERGLKRSWYLAHLKKSHELMQIQELGQLIVSKMKTSDSNL